MKKSLRKHHPAERKNFHTYKKTAHKSETSYETNRTSSGTIKHEPGLH